MKLALHWLDVLNLNNWLGIVLTLVIVFVLPFYLKESVFALALCPLCCGHLARDTTVVNRLLSE